MTNAMPDGVDVYHRQMADRERRGEEPGFKSHASKPDHAPPYRAVLHVSPETISSARQPLPAMFVGLIGQLPADGRWTAERRATWFETCRTLVDLVCEVVEEDDDA